MSSIAYANRLKELEARLVELEARVGRAGQTATEALCNTIDLQHRTQLLENRPKPGRPPKNG